MEDDAPVKRSVAELAGKFKSQAQPVTTTTDGCAPVRRRPPRTLQIPMPTAGQGEEQKPGVTSPHPAKAKRNSALIEKLQANLSPQCFLPSPKSPGLRLLPPSFAPPSPSFTPPSPSPAPTSPSPSPAPTSPSPTSPRHQSEEETPASFETPAAEAKADGSLLPSINKSRARLSLRRRPPSRRHRKSSSGEEVGGATEEDTPLSTPAGPDPTGGGGGGGGDKEEEEGVFKGTHPNKEMTGSKTEGHPKTETKAEPQTQHPSETKAAPQTQKSSETKAEPQPQHPSETKTAPQTHECIETKAAPQTSSCCSEPGRGGEKPEVRRRKRRAPGIPSSTEGGKEGGKEGAVEGADGEKKGATADGKDTSSGDGETEVKECQRDTSTETSGGADKTTSTQKEEEREESTHPVQEEEEEAKGKQLDDEKRERDIDPKKDKEQKDIDPKKDKEGQAKVTTSKS